MNRRGFLGRVLGAAVAAKVAPEVLAEQQWTHQAYLAPAQFSSTTFTLADFHRSYEIDIAADGNERKSLIMRPPVEAHNRLMASIFRAK